MQGEQIMPALEGLRMQSDFLENQGSVSATEAEGVAHGNIHAGFTGNIWNIVQIALRILIVHIDGRRQNLVTDSQHAEYRFNTTRCTQQMPGHGLGGTDCHFVSMIA